MEEDTISDSNERTLFSNLLLLGYDANKPRMVELTHGMLKHGNKKAAEAILYFIFSCLRTPQQLQKDFYGIWPIYENRQSRDFFKVIQNLVAELNGLEALRKSTSRASLFATAGGDRFVEFLLFLSAHALREAYLKSVDGEVTAEVPPPLPLVPSKASAALLTISKARVKILGKQVLEAVPAAVQMQARYIKISNEQKTEYAALEAEKAQIVEQKKMFLGKLSTTNLPGNSYREQILKEHGAAVGATAELWKSLMESAEGNQALAAGPVADMITQRSHRYGIDGLKLREAMAKSVTGKENNSQGVGLSQISAEFASQAESFSSDQSATGSGRQQGEVDISTLIQDFTRVLEHVEKQTLSFSNGGNGPELLKMGEGTQSFLRQALAKELQHKELVEEEREAVRKTRKRMEEDVAMLRKKVADMEARAGPILAKLYGPSRPLQANGQGPAATRGSTPAMSACGGDMSVPGGADGAPGSAVLGRLQLVPPTPAMKMPHLRSEAAEQSPERLPAVEDSPNSATSSRATGPSQSHCSISLTDADPGDGAASLRRLILEAAKRRASDTKSARNLRSASLPSLDLPPPPIDHLIPSHPTDLVGSFSEHQAVPLGVSKWSTANADDYPTSHQGRRAGSHVSPVAERGRPGHRRRASHDLGAKPSPDAATLRPNLRTSAAGSGNPASLGIGPPLKTTPAATSVADRPRNTSSGKSPDFDVTGDGELRLVDSFDLLAPIPMNDFPHDLPEL